MTAPMNCEVVGRWRIVEADLWDRDYLDLVEPAMMTIQADGHGEIAFGAMQASLDLEYSRSAVFFTWAGFGRWTRSAAPDRPNCSMTVRSKSSSHTTSAMKLSSKPSA